MTSFDKTSHDVKSKVLWTLQQGREKIKLEIRNIRRILPSNAHRMTAMPHTSNPRFDDDIHSTRCLILSLHICLFYHFNIFAHVYFQFQQCCDLWIRNYLFRIRPQKSSRFCTKSRLFNVRRYIILRFNKHTSIFMLWLLELLSFRFISGSNPNPGPEYYSWSAEAAKRSGSTQHLFLAQEIFCDPHKNTTLWCHESFSLFSRLFKWGKNAQIFAYVFLENSFVIVPSFLFYNVLSISVDVRSVPYSTEICVQSDRK